MAKKTKNKSKKDYSNMDEEKIVIQMSKDLLDRMDFLKGQIKLCENEIEERGLVITSPANGVIQSPYIKNLDTLNKQFIACITKYNQINLVDESGDKSAVEDYHDLMSVKLRKK